MELILATVQGRASIQAILALLGDLFAPAPATKMVITASHQLELYVGVRASMATAYPKNVMELVLVFPSL